MDFSLITITETVNKDFSSIAYQYLPSAQSITFLAKILCCISKPSKHEQTLTLQPHFSLKHHTTPFRTISLHEKKDSDMQQQVHHNKKDALPPPDLQAQVRLYLRVTWNNKDPDNIFVASRIIKSALIKIKHSF